MPMLETREIHTAGGVLIVGENYVRRGLNTDVAMRMWPICSWAFSCMEKIYRNG